MNTRLPVVLVLGLILVGCGGKAPLYTTTEKRLARAASKHDTLSAHFDIKARSFVMNEDAQEQNAPFMPGYNARGETAPLTGMAPVTSNIAKEWEEIVFIMEQGEPYDYVALDDLGQTLVMRSEELKKARFIELEKEGVRPDKHKDDETDRAIMRFGVLARRFKLAAATRRVDELVEVYTVFPASTQFIESASYQETPLGGR